MVFAGFFASLNKVVFGESLALVSFQNNTSTGNTFSLSSSHPVKDVHFIPDGSAFFMLGSDTVNSADRVYKYDMTTNYDITTASYSQNVVISTANAGRYEAILFNAAGTQLYITQYTEGQKVNGNEVSFNRIRTFTLSTAWDLTTISSPTDYTFSVGRKRHLSMSFNDNGTKIYMASSDSKKLYEYSLSTAYDVSSLQGINPDSGASATYDYNTISGGQSVASFQFTNNGKVLFFLYTAGGGAILELSTAYNLSTISVHENFASGSVPTQLNNTGTEFTINLVDPPGSGTKYFISSHNTMYENQF